MRTEELVVEAVRLQREHAGGGEGLYAVSQAHIAKTRPYLRSAEFTQRHVLSRDETVEELLLLVVLLVERLIGGRLGHLLVCSLRDTSRCRCRDFFDKRARLQRSISLRRISGGRDAYGLRRHERSDHVQVLKLLSNDSLRYVDSQFALFDIIASLLTPILNDFVRKREPER